MRGLGEIVLGWITAMRMNAPLDGADSPFNNPPGVDIWCGKAYKAE